MSRTRVCHEPERVTGRVTSQGVSRARACHRSGLVTGCVTSQDVSQARACHGPGRVTGQCVSRAVSQASACHGPEDPQSVDLFFIGKPKKFIAKPCNVKEIHFKFV